MDNDNKQEKEKNLEVDKKKELELKRLIRKRKVYESIIIIEILIFISIVTLRIVDINKNKTEECQDNKLENNAYYKSPTVQTIYNSKFEKYFGDVNGALTKALINYVSSHNRAVADDENLKISISLTYYIDEQETIFKTDDNDKIKYTEDVDLNKLKTQIKAGKIYKIEGEYDEKTGYITHIQITESI